MPSAEVRSLGCRVLRKGDSRARVVTTFQRFVVGVGARFAVLPASDDVSRFRVRWSARDIVAYPCPAPRAAVVRLA
jgi:hypothetical protein